MTESEYINQMVLKQLGHGCEDDYEERLFQARLQRNNHSAIVNDVACRIAKAAFSSQEYSPSISGRLIDAGTGIIGTIKDIVKKPGVKEGLIIGSVMLFKMGLWFSYRRASSEGLNIVDL